MALAAAAAMLLMPKRLAKLSNQPAWRSMMASAAARRADSCAAL
jgi:hypothetical protein